MNKTENLVTAETEMKETEWKAIMEHDQTNP